MRTMTFQTCLENAIRDKRLTQKQEEGIYNRYAELVPYFRSMTDVVDAEMAAANRAVKEFDAERLRKKFNFLQQRKIQQNIQDYFASYDGGNNYGNAAKALIERDYISKFPGLANWAESVQKMLMTKMDEALAQFGIRSQKQLLTNQMGNPKLLKDMVREVFGEDTGNATAKELAKAWKDTAEIARLRFNRAGGNIAKKADWGLSQIHDSVAIRKIGMVEWKKFITDNNLLDVTRMYSSRTGSQILPSELDGILTEVYQNIVTDGWSKRKPSGKYVGKSQLANRYQDHRFLQFRNADAWMMYQEKFGDTNPFANMLHYVDKMSKDIASLEILGPNPNATLNYVEGLVKAKAAENIGTAAQKTDFMQKADSDIRYFRDMYDIYTGTANIPMNNTAANFFKSIRSGLQSIQLGAAALSAIGDLNTQRIAAQMAGLPVNRLMKRIVSNLNPANFEGNAKFAIRSGLHMEAWANIGNTQARFYGEVAGSELASRLSSSVMRASGLEAWTQANRHAFGLEFMAHLADNIDKPFAEIDGPLKNVLSRYGLDGENWDLIRQSPLHMWEGQGYLRPDEIRLADHMPDALTGERLATQMLEMIVTETNYAVPTTTIKTKAMLGGATRPGTFVGELIRSGAMYKNYAVTVLGNNLMRMAHDKTITRNLLGMELSPKAARATYMIDYLIGATAVGAVALQLKEMVKGRDPRAMDTASFWGASMLQGGALGIFGDFLFSDTNRYGAGLAETIAGPVVSLGNDIKKLTVGNIYEAAQGKDTNIARESISFVGKYAPYSSLWYAGLGFRRMMIENLMLWADPDSIDSLRRQEQKYHKETGQDFWWRPGQTFPDRAPAIGSETLLTQ